MILPQPAGFLKGFAGLDPIITLLFRRGLPRQGEEEVGTPGANSEVKERG